MKNKLEILISNIETSTYVLDIYEKELENLEIRIVNLFRI